MQRAHSIYLVHAIAVIVGLGLVHRLGLTQRLQHVIAVRVKRPVVQAILVAAPLFIAFALVEPQLAGPAAFLAIAIRYARRGWLGLWLVCLLSIAVAAFAIPLRERADGQALDPAVAARLSALAKHAGVDIPPDRVVVQHSERIDGYTIGVGPARTILLTSAAVATLADDELAFLFGHELGHYDFASRYGWLAIGGVALLLLLLLRGFARIAPERVDIHKVPLLLLAIVVLQLVATPVRALLQRRFEHDADAFGLRAITGFVPDPRNAAARSLTRLGAGLGSRPDPSAFDIVYGVDHPPMSERIEFVLRAPQR